MFSQDPGHWVAAFLTLGLFSWMYKENPWFRLVEHIFVGASLGHMTVVGYQNIVEMAWRPMAGGKYILILPLIGGLLLLSRWFRPYAYLSRVPMGYLMGTTGAVVMTGAIKSSLIDQITATMMPLNTINNLIFVLCCLSATVYFLFTVQQKYITPLTTLGRYALMTAFGAAFGYTVMSRISLFTGRMQFLLTDWLKVIR